ncbi:MAG TPA: VOC family protein [Gaiellaceae bacterium]|nr:VOC family protein [Gaiellaceae bacterium]
MEVEHVDFISVPVSDMERSTAWYRDTLGLPQTSEGGGFPEFKLGNNVFLYLVDPKQIGGEYRHPHSAPIALRVADVAETRKELEGRGIEFIDETFDTGVCHMAPFADPDGNRFMLHRRYAPNES